jgi:hypothetical protein
MFTSKAAGALIGMTTLLAACGGGGGDASPGSTSTTPAGPSAVTYASSIVVGSLTAQSVDYTAPATGAGASASAYVSVTAASTLLSVGRNTLVAEHLDASLPGTREVCVSGRGESTNVVAPINLGVIAQSAAVLLDTSWSPVADQTAAWASIAATGLELSGWQNCGVKPEGLPSRSSALRPQSGGGYIEDVYDGNPGTTFNVVTQNVPASQVAAMLSSTGFAAVDGLQNPVRLYWRLYANGAGRQLLIESGIPASGAAGFVAAYALPG